MRNLWYKDHYRTNHGKLFDQVNEELEKYHGSRYEKEDIELFGEIENSYELVNYGSRELVLAKWAGKVYSTEEELNEYERMMNGGSYE